jgi:hypothetical protein
VGGRYIDLRNVTMVSNADGSEIWTLKYFASLKPERYPTDIGHLRSRAVNWSSCHSVIVRIIAAASGNAHRLVLVGVYCSPIRNLVIK